MSSIDDIKPGQNYPSRVLIKEKDGTEARFCLNSYFVGMYAAIYLNGELVAQSGDHDNKTFCRKLKKDIAKAQTRGATIEIMGIVPIKTTMN